jgi:glycosyltransferase involved in cell wall biosynthesis
MEAVVGIDASRNRSGGAKAHLVGILQEGDPPAHGIREVHVWSYRSLLDVLPDKPWLIKHSPPELERSIFHQVWWQYRTLPKEVLRHGCDILLNTSAGTVCPFHPAVVMSREMLCFEKGEMLRYGFSVARLRLMLLRILQIKSMREADGVIFLTKYASKIIQESTGKLECFSIIPHGVGTAFKQYSPSATLPIQPDKAIRCLYVSNAAMYKHQWVVVNAIGELRRRGHNVSLLLAGGGAGRAQNLLDKEIARTDPQHIFTETLGFVDPDKLPALLAGSDLFVFASSCENMPNTLVEAMAIGLPIACSDRGPMPEVLRDGGVYFDPEVSESITAAVEKIITDSDLRIFIARRAKALAEQYSWARCAAETWDFLLTKINK